LGVEHSPPKGKPTPTPNTNTNLVANSASATVGRL